MEQLRDILWCVAIILAMIAALFLYAKAIIDIHKRNSPSLKEKSMWLTIVVLAPLMGSIFYYYSKKQRGNHTLPV